MSIPDHRAASGIGIPSAVWTRERRQALRCGLRLQTRTAPGPKSSAVNFLRKPELTIMLG